MRILFVTGEYPPQKGGVGRYSFNLVAALKEEKDIEIIVATGNREKASANFNLTPYASNDKLDSISRHLMDDNGTKIYYGIIKKGDPKNSDRLLDLVKAFNPDVVNVQYERGLYESDTSVKYMLRRILYGSTLHKFYYKCPVSVVSTLHTVMPKEEYEEYISERSKKVEGRIAFMPKPLRSIIRKWVLNN